MDIEWLNEYLPQMTKWMENRLTAIMPSRSAPMPQPVDPLDLCRNFVMLDNRMRRIRDAEQRRANGGPINQWGSMPRWDEAYAEPEILGGDRQGETRYV